MATASTSLSTDYVDDVLSDDMDGLRRYNMIKNSDGTVSFEDATTYTTTGSEFGADDINLTNTVANLLAEEAGDLAERGRQIYVYSEGIDPADFTYDSGIDYYKLSLGKKTVDGHVARPLCASAIFYSDAELDYDWDCENFVTIKQDNTAYLFLKNDDTFNSTYWGDWPTIAINVVYWINADNPIDVSTLSTDYVDDELSDDMDGKRRYNMIENSDGTVSFEDATTYTTTGSEFGAAAVNAANGAVNDIACRLYGQANYSSTQKYCIYAKSEVFSSIDYDDTSSPRILLTAPNAARTDNPLLAAANGDWDASNYYVKKAGHRVGSNYTAVPSAAPSWLYRITSLWYLKCSYYPDRDGLSESFKDDVLSDDMDGKRRYNMIENSDGTVSFEDVTTYTTTGSDFGADEINELNSAINKARTQVTTLNGMNRAFIARTEVVTGSSNGNFCYLAQPSSAYHLVAAANGDWDASIAYVVGCAQQGANGVVFLNQIWANPIRIDSLWVRVYG